MLNWVKHSSRIHGLHSWALSGFAGSFWGFKQKEEFRGFQIGLRNSLPSSADPPLAREVSESPSTAIRDGGLNGVGEAGMFCRETQKCRLFCSKPLWITFSCNQSADHGRDICYGTKPED